LDSRGGPASTRNPSLPFSELIRLIRRDRRMYAALRRMSS
jgi:hypothetical protein